MHYDRYIKVLILLIAVVSLLGCTGSQTVTDNQNTGGATAQISKAPTATSNPSSNSLGFSRKNPAPIGTPLTYNFEITQQDSKTGKYSYVKAQEAVTILNAKRGYDAVESKLTDEEKHTLEYFRTSDGYENYEPLLLSVKYELVSIDKDLINPWYISDYSFSNLIATNGTVYNNGGSYNGPIGLTEFSFNSYEPKAAEGDVLLFVYKDDPAPVLRFNGGDYRADMWFKTTY